MIVFFSTLKWSGLALVVVCHSLKKFKKATYSPYLTNKHQSCLASDIFSFGFENN